MACWAEALVIEGLGFTVMVKEPGVPVQLAAEGVTVNVENTVLSVAFTPVKEGTTSVPVEGKMPTAGLEADQAKDVPFTFPVKLTAAVVSPAHTVWLTTGFTFGVGFTVMLKFCVFPGQDTADVLKKDSAVKLAVTPVRSVISTSQEGDFPLQAPAQPLKTEP